MTGRHSYTPEHGDPDDPLYDPEDDGAVLAHDLHGDPYEPDVFDTEPDPFEDDGAVPPAGPVRSNKDEARAAMFRRGLGRSSRADEPLGL